MAVRKKVTRPRSGQTMPTLLRLSEYMRFYLDRKCDASEEKLSLTALVTRSIQDGEYYEEDLARTVKAFFEANPEIRDKYQERFLDGRPHPSYVTEERLDFDTLAVSDFIREAIEEKIVREAPEYEPEIEKERERHWDWLYETRETAAESD